MNDFGIVEQKLAGSTLKNLYNNVQNTTNEYVENNEGNSLSIGFGRDIVVRHKR